MRAILRLLARACGTSSISGIFDSGKLRWTTGGAGEVLGEVGLMGEGGGWVWDAVMSAR